MDAGSIERLLIRQGEKPTDRHLRALDAAIARNTPLRGLNVRQRVLPWGTIRNYHGSAGGTAFPVFAPQVTTGAQIAEIRWSGPRAFIGGVVPTIAGVEIFDDSQGNRPALVVSRAEFGDEIQCGIYFRVTVDPADDYRAQLIEPVALAKLPPRAPFVAHKLALFLRLRGGRISYSEGDDRALFCSQTFFAAERRANGIFTPLFGAEF